jgi:hypothetical protein
MDVQTRIGLGGGAAFAIAGLLALILSWKIVCGIMAVCALVAAWGFWPLLRNSKVIRIGGPLRSKQMGAAPAPSRNPHPDLPICDLFAHINPDFLSRTDDDVGDAWDKVGNNIRDQASLGHLEIWGRIVRDGPDRILGQRAALQLIEPSYWTKAFFTYSFFDNRSGDTPHTYLEAGQTGVEYTDLNVNRAEALSIWPSSGRNALQILLRVGGDFESRQAVGLYKTRHTFNVSVKNNGRERFLSNCKFYLNIADRKGQTRQDYALAIDPFTLNPTEERYFPIVSYAEPASISRHADDFIQLHIPVVGAYYGIGSGWPWRLPVGAYAFSLFATSKESGRTEVPCKIWVDDDQKLHFAKA